MDKITLIKNLNIICSLQDKKGYFVDPVTHHIDPRGTAEICKSLLYIGKKAEAEMGFNWLAEIQANNGSWNEVLHDGFNEESCVATSIIGRLMLIAYEKTKNKHYLQSALKCSEYLISREFSPGYFIKSYRHYGDVLNVNACCAAFFYKLYEVTKDKKNIIIRDRAIFNIIRYQFKDGFYPYASRMLNNPYEYHLNVRDPHYHAITLYFLMLSDPKFENRYLKLSVEKAINCMKKNIVHGKFDWSFGHLQFSLGLNGGYAYVYYCLRYTNNNTLLKKSDVDSNGLILRHEKIRIYFLIKRILKEIFNFGVDGNTNYSLWIRLFRLKGIAGRLKMIYFRNKVSLYYTAQMYDCLTEFLFVSK